MKAADLLINLKTNTPTCGIYMILVVPTGAAYIGQSTNISARWETHKKDLKLGTHHNKGLQKAWDTHGEYGLHFAVISNCHPASLLEEEGHFISALDKNLCLNSEVACLIEEVSEIKKREDSLRELLSLLGLQCKKRNLHFDVHKPNGEILQYFPDSGRWRAKGRKKLYFSKSAVQFIRSYVLDGKSKFN